MEMTAQMWIALVVGLAATVEDVVWRRISNWIPLAALAGGLGWQVADKGWPGIGWAALGSLSGFSVFLVFYLLGGMGGGDVKLMAGFGALLGAGRLLEAALWTAMIGGLLAMIVIAAGAIRRRLSKAPRAAGPQFIPYAPAITVGVWMSLVPR